MNGGPIQGYDIAVYKVKTDFKLGTPPRYLSYDPTDSKNDDTTEQLYNDFENHVWPACFPKEKYESTKGFIAGWLDSPGTLKDPLKLGIESFSYEGQT